MAISLNKEEIEFEDANKGDKPTMELLVANTSDRLYTPVLMHLPQMCIRDRVNQVLALFGHEVGAVPLGKEHSA